MKRLENSDNSTTALSLFIIGVPHKFRGAQIIDFCSSLDLTIEVIHGEDAELISGNHFSKIASPRSAKAILRREITRGEVCCSQAHLNAYKAFLQGNAEWALIFEDDVKVFESTDFRVLLPLLSKLAKPSIIQLSPLTTHEKFSKLRENRINLRGDSGVGIQKKLAPSTNADAYFINRAAAKIAVHCSDGRKIHYTADWPYLWDWKVDFWHSNHPFFIQGGKSLLETDRKEVRPSQFLRPRSNSDRAKDFIRDFSGFTALTIWLSKGSVYSYYRSRVFSKVAIRGKLFREHLEIIQRSKANSEE
jgi:GR25 family glycosyltransferase involved in LPS biosynthesis